MSPNEPDDLRELRAEVERIRQELTSLDRRLSQAERKQTAPRQPFSPQYPPTEPPPIVTEQPPKPTPESRTTPSATDPIPSYLRSLNRGLRESADSPTPTAPPIEKPPARSEAMEVVIGRTWLNRIGALILLLGIGFFVKYSFDKGWISPTIRCCIGAAIGLALVAAGEISLRRKLQSFAVGLLGAGTATLYFSAFAAYYFYHLLNVQTTFALLSGITFLSTVLAVHGNILAIAILTLLGGFWTPLALSTGQNAQVALLTYILILDVGFLLSGVIRRWDALRVLTFLGTVALFVGWFQKFYAPPALWTTLAFILAFYVVYFIEAQFSIRRRTRDDGATLTIIYTLATSCFFASIYFLTRHSHHQWLGLFAVLTAALQLLAAWRLGRLGAQANTLREAQLVAGFTFLAFAAPLQFDHYLVPIAWGLQAMVSLWFCRNHQRPWLRIKAGAILVAALGHLLIFDYNDPRLAPHLFSVGDFYLNWLLLLFVGLALAAYASAATLTIRCAVQKIDIPFVIALLAFGSVIILGITADQYERYLATWCWLTLTVAWYLVALSFPKTSPICVILVFVVAIKFLIWDTLAATSGPWSNLHGIFRNRAVLTGLLVAAMSALASPMLSRLSAATDPNAQLGKVTTHRAFAGLLPVMSALIITWTGTFEILRIFQFEPWRLRFPHPQDAQNIYITAFWVLNAAALWLIFGTRKPALAGYTYVLTWLTLLKFGTIDTQSAIMDSTWRDLSGIGTNRIFLVGLAVIALGLLAYAYVRATRQTTGPWFTQPQACTALLAFTVVLMTWLPTFEIMRAFKFEEIRDRFKDPNLAMHVALSIFWGLAAIAMLIVGFARLINVLRYMAIALFGITVAKVFIIDLSHLEMIYRVVSFIVLGVLLLLASLLYQKLAPRIAPKLIPS